MNSSTDGEDTDRWKLNMRSETLYFVILHQRI